MVNYHNYGKSQFLLGKPLFQWPCSIAFCMFTRPGKWHDPPSSRVACTNSAVKHQGSTSPSNVNPHANTHFLLNLFMNWGVISLITSGWFILWLFNEDQAAIEWWIKPAVFFFFNGHFMMQPRLMICLSMYTLVGGAITTLKNMKVTGKDYPIYYGKLKKTIETTNQYICHHMSGKPS